MSRKLFLTILLAVMTLYSGNTVSAEAQQNNKIPPLHQVISEFEAIVNKSGQHQNIVNLGKNLLGLSTSELDKDCNHDNIEEGLTQCDSLNSYLICYANRKCGCLDADRILEDFDGKLGEYQAAFEGAVRVLKELGAALKTSYNPSIRKCFGDPGSICPIRGIFYTQELPGPAELTKSFNDMRCVEGLDCSDNLNNIALKGIVGRCSGTHLIPLSLGLLFGLASLLLRIL